MMLLLDVDDEDPRPGGFGVDQLGAQAAGAGGIRGMGRDEPACGEGGGVRRREARRVAE